MCIYREMINVHVKADDREKKRIARDQYEREAKMRDNINKEIGRAHV